MRISASSSRLSILKWVALPTLLILFFAAQSGKAQSLGYEGPTGIFVTPLAATAASPAKAAGQPVVAYHLLAGGPEIGTFNTFSVTEGFARHFEFGYTREQNIEGSDTKAGGTNQGISPLWKGGLDIYHGKVVFLPENYAKHKWVPAVAIGGILRNNDQFVGGSAAANAGSVAKPTTNGDIYIVATKIVTQTKKVPLVLNAGVRGTNASLWGLGGNAPSWSARGFGAVGFVLTGPKKSTIILASEVAQQPQHVKLGGVSALDIPTSIDYAARIVPLAGKKLNVDFGILQAAGKVGGVDLKARARFAFGISYGF